jgi:hypothetical protein
MNKTISFNETVEYREFETDKAIQRWGKLYYSSLNDIKPGPYVPAHQRLKAASECILLNMY